ncbi:MAG: helix-turn-helix domain-containing protein [Clostridia bacterium]|nr:helix-turn-helix domain-containing protein [Clostridia bacterium]
MNYPIAETIRRLRRDKDITQEELANALGVTYQSVSRWENAQAYPDIEQIPRLAAYFGVTTDLLFGVDKDTREGKLRAYYDKYWSKGITDKERLAITREIVREIPDAIDPMFDLIYQLSFSETEPIEKNLPEMRKYAHYILDHSDSRNDRFQVIKIMALAETDEFLEDWLSYIPNERHMSRADLLEERYKHRNEADKSNYQQQINLFNDLEHLFLERFGKRDAKHYKNAAAGMAGQTIVLQIIDTLRDTSTDIDGWIVRRAFTYLRLASAAFGSGHKEEGYAALEKGVDLYEKFWQLPDGTELEFHTPVLDLVKQTKTEKWGDNDLTMPPSIPHRCLTVPKGWEWFNGVREEERFQEQVRRIEKYMK